MDLTFLPVFYLFGFGSRRKLQFQNGALLDARTGETLRHWDAIETHIDAFEYSVCLQTRDAGEVHLWEDEDGVWLEESGQRECLASGAKVHLPRFENNPHAALLRALHADILVNITEHGPLPNFYVYPKPWNRDAALMAMCLQHSGNLHLIEEWIMGLPREFDCNNYGHHEADNLGQVLYMLSLVSDARHPMVDRVLESVKQFQKDDYIVGMTDYAQYPVFQTKWLKFGLRALGLDDSYRIPAVFDAYSCLFWMDYRDEHVEGPSFSESNVTNYPYLAWAQAHFHNDAPPLHLLNTTYPFTWEGAGSDAYYTGVNRISTDMAARRLCAPHTWHAAEAFLYLIEKNHKP